MRCTSLASSEASLPQASLLHARHLQLFLLPPDSQPCLLVAFVQGLATSILSVKVQLTRTHGRCKGYAFVTFSDAAAVAQAQRTVHEVGGGGSLEEGGMAAGKI